RGQSDRTSSFADSYESQPIDRRHNRATQDDSRSAPGRFADGCWLRNRSNGRVLVLLTSFGAKGLRRPAHLISRPDVLALRSTRIEAAPTRAGRRAVADHFLLWS